MVGGYEASNFDLKFQANQGLPKSASLPTFLEAVSRPSSHIKRTNQDIDVYFEQSCVGW